MINHVGRRTRASAILVIDSFFAFRVILTVPVAADRREIVNGRGKMNMSDFLPMLTPTFHNRHVWMLKDRGPTAPTIEIMKLFFERITGTFKYIRFLSLR